MPTHINYLVALHETESLIKFPTRAQGGKHTNTLYGTMGATRKNTQHFCATVGANCCFNRKSFASQSLWIFWLFCCLPFWRRLSTFQNSAIFRCRIVVVVLLVAAAKLTCCTMPTECRRQMQQDLAGKIVVQSPSTLAAPPPSTTATNSTKMPDTPTKLRDGAKPANRVQPNVAARPQTHTQKGSTTPGRPAAPL